MKAEYDFTHGRRGPVITPEVGKTRITIRLDNDILDWFRTQVSEQGGGNYQTMINNALREFTRQEKPLAEVVRDVIREELRRAA